MKRLLCQCFLTWPIYLSSESAQKLTSRWCQQHSLMKTQKWYDILKQKGKSKAGNDFNVVALSKGEKDVCCSLPRVQIRERNTYMTLTRRVYSGAKIFMESLKQLM